MNHSNTLALHRFFSGSPSLAFLAILFAQWLPYLLILFAATWTFINYAFHGIFRSFLFVFAPAAIAWLFVDFIKWLYPMARPFNAFDLTPLVTVSDPLGSFPSGHASAFAALGMTIFLRNKKAGTWFLLGALVIGLGRIAAGVHYPLDILAGFLLGGVIAFLCHRSFLKFSKLSSSRQ